MKTKYTLIRCGISISLLVTLFAFSNCTSLLSAKFESDTIGNLPNKTLPGNPSGDEILYVAAIETQLEIIATPGSTSNKSLEYQGNSPSGDVSGHSSWVTFKSKSSNFAKPVTFTWAGRIASLTAESLYIDLSDGSGVVAARIRILDDGTVRLVNDIVTGNGTDIGSIGDNVAHTFIVTVNLQTATYNVSVFKSGGNLERLNVPLLTSNVAEYHNPARPTASFNYSGYISSNRYILDEIFISRKN
ncbi:MAG TPA: hypothetical protein VFW11_17505 [Cyclobacteriaceae bacterium]|nr:hypothetical protein [Cyclobacteriaceae bacterium]